THTDLDRMPLLGISRAWVPRVRRSSEGRTRVRRPVFSTEGWAASTGAGRHKHPTSTRGTRPRESSETVLPKHRSHVAQPISRLQRGDQITLRHELVPDVAGEPRIRNRATDRRIVHLLSLIHIPTPRIPSGVIVGEIGMIVTD